MKHTLKSLTYLGFATVGTQAYAHDLDRSIANHTNLHESSLTSNGDFALSKFMIPEMDEEKVQKRLSLLERDIKLPYSQKVFKIIHEYTVTAPQSTIGLLNRKTFYFPIFEQILAKHNLPEELKYVAVLESHLKTEIKSYASAAGLWQFMPVTGKGFGLQQTDSFDERADPFRATEAACQYFKYLYEKLGDWHLVLAAYNCGEGGVLSAMKKAGSNRYEDVYPYLPAQTKGYVPTFVAMAYLMNFAHEHDIFPNDKQMPRVVADEWVATQNTSLQRFAKRISVDVAILELLNPHLKGGIVPKGYVLHYPADKMELVNPKKAEELEKKRKINARRQARKLRRQKEEVTPKRQEEFSLKLLHKVEQGQNLLSIAEYYEVDIAFLRDWNNLPNNRIDNGQLLTVWVRERRRRLGIKSNKQKQKVTA